MPFRNPPVIDDSGAAPANGTVLVYDLSTDTWVATTLGSLPAAAIPQAHPTEPTQTGIAVATTGATTSSPGGYTTTAQANAIVAELNAATVDIATLITWADALQTKLTTAGILD
jgi:hypothetical protein